MTSNSQIDQNDFSSIYCCRSYFPLSSKRRSEIWSCAVDQLSHTTTEGVRHCFLCAIIYQNTKSPQDYNGRLRVFWIKLDLLPFGFINDRLDSNCRETESSEWEVRMWWQPQIKMTMLFFPLSVPAFHYNHLLPKHAGAQFRRFQLWLDCQYGIWLKAKLNQIRVVPVSLVVVR